MTRSFKLHFIPARTINFFSACYEEFIYSRSLVYFSANFRIRARRAVMFLSRVFLNSCRAICLIGASAFSVMGLSFAKSNNCGLTFLCN